MALVLDLELEVNVAPDVQSAVRRAIETVLQLQAQSDVELAILLTDDEALRRLNRQFRQQDEATDVLSFPAGDALPGMLSEDRYLGDIAISVPYAQRQAEEKGHELSAELQLLAIHGVLHLLGYDHVDESQRHNMWIVQRRALDHLGLSYVEPAEDAE